MGWRNPNQARLLSDLVCYPEQLHAPAYLDFSTQGFLQQQPVLQRNVFCVERMALYSGPYGAMLACKSAQMHLVACQLVNLNRFLSHSRPATQLQHAHLQQASIC